MVALGILGSLDFMFPWEEDFSPVEERSLLEEAW